jgi:hypothetical protein
VAKPDPAKNASKPGTPMKKKNRNEKMPSRWGMDGMPLLGMFMVGPGCEYTGTDGKRHMTVSMPYQPERYEYKSKFDYPYTYSPIIIFGEDTGKEQECVYSDRMFQWDYEKTEKLLIKYFGSPGQYFNDKDPAQIEKFLQERFDYPNLKLLMIVEWCNVSNGYPLWSFHFTK